MSKIEAVCRSNCGKVRLKNQDNFLFCGQMRETDNVDPVHLPSKGSERIDRKKEYRLVGVFDGMGGAARGEKASEIAAAHFMSIDPHEFPKDEDWFTDQNQSANVLVQDFSDEIGMESGTTSVLMYFRRNRVFVSNVGDSRAYQWRKGTFNQLSKDHSDIQTLQELNITNRNPRLFQYLGLSDRMKVKPDTNIFKFKSGDYYLCCSDGLYSMLPENEISKILSNRKTSLSIKADILMDTALENGGKDNITFILCYVKSVL